MSACRAAVSNETSATESVADIGLEAGGTGSAMIAPLSVEARL
jgi:hypothetical protein